MYNVERIYGQGGWHSMKQNFITVNACATSCPTCLLMKAVSPLKKKKKNHPASSLRCPTSHTEVSELWMHPRTMHWRFICLLWLFLFPVKMPINWKCSWYHLGIKKKRYFMARLRNKIYKSFYTSHLNFLTSILPHFCQDTSEFTLLQVKA